MKAEVSIPASTRARRIAIQGVEGSFHEIAAHKFFGEDIELDMCDSFPKLFRRLNTFEVDFGIIAIENSVAGSLLPNYALLRESDYTILGEVYLRIQHNLMALPGTRVEKITEIHSHPMALNQCQQFLGKFPHIKMVESEDTAQSAQQIREASLSNRAAIASLRAASVYDLAVMEEAIEDNPRNFTRFLILVHQESELLKEVSPQKASLCFNLAKMSQRVGSLAGILSILGHYDMNLTKIQSLPLVGHEWQYFFHIDLEFEAYDRYQQALDAIRPLVSELKILGEYSRGEKPLATDFQTSTP
ncbi:MAG: prephenate dehydratase [Bacteroidota bacterium]